MCLIFIFSMAPLMLHLPNYANPCVPFLVGFFKDFSSSILFIEKFINETKGIPFRDGNIDDFILILMF